MKKSTKAVTAGIVTLIAAGTTLVAFSGQDDKDHSPELVNEASVNIDQAMAIALADVPGKVIEAEIEREDGTLVWEIEVLNNQNQVFEFEIDANDGRILEKEQDDD